MNELQIFKNAEFGSIRTTTINGEPYFVGRDIAEILGYSNTKDAISTHVDEEDRTVIQRSENTTLEIPNRGLTVINESGLYSLILSSKMPNAKKFKHWVTSEVLPAIRKHGVFAVDEVLANPDVLINALMELKKEREEKSALQQIVAIQNQQIIEMKPKASYYDVVLNCKDLVAISVIAKDYGWTANHMNQYLHEKGISKVRKFGSCIRNMRKWDLHQLRHILTVVLTVQLIPSLILIGHKRVAYSFMTF